MSAGPILQDPPRKLESKRILVVEDEYYLADDLRRALTSAGAEVIGPYSTIDDGNEALDCGDFDYAIVDLNLRGESAVEIADRLLAMGKSFAIATGYGSSAIPEHLQGVPRIEKPFDTAALVSVVANLSCSASATAV